MKTTRIQILFAQHVVEDNSGAGQEAAAALAVGEGHGGKIAGRIDHGNLRGAARALGPAQNLCAISCHQGGVEEPGDGRILHLRAAGLV